MLDQGLVPPRRNASGSILCTLASRASSPCGDLRSNHGGAALRHRFEGQFGLIVTRRRWCSSPPPHLTTGQIIASFRDVVRAVGRCDSLQRARGACPSSRPHDTVSSPLQTPRESLKASRSPVTSPSIGDTAGPE